MPIKDANTVRKLIYYQYAKNIARGISHAHNNLEAREKAGFAIIMSKYKQLRDGDIHWSDITKEDREFAQSVKDCIYCGAKDNLSWEHIVPKSLKINDKCPECKAIQGISNQVWACRSCNSSKGQDGLYKFFKRISPKGAKYFDIMPPLLEKKYLKTIYDCHKCAKTLDKPVDSGSTDSYLELDFEVGE